MKIVLLAILILHLAMPTSQAATKIFLLAGQSNMDGRGKKSDLVGPLAPFANPQPDVRIAYSNSTLRGPYTSNGFQPLEPGFSVPPGTREAHGKDFKLPASTFGPEVSFGRTIADALPNDKIVLIKFSEGGTSLHKDWAISDPKSLYPQCIAFVRSSLESLNEPYELAGIIWHQGESDASLSAAEYQKLLTDFITRLRKDLNAPELTFVVAEVFDSHERDNVRTAQRATTQAVAHTLFVSADRLTTSDHGTHFDAASQIELGRRIARRWLEAQK